MRKKRKVSKAEMKAWAKHARFDVSVSIPDDIRDGMEQDRQPLYRDIDTESMKKLDCKPAVKKLVLVVNALLLVVVSVVVLSKLIPPSEPLVTSLTATVATTATPTPTPSPTPTPVPPTPTPQVDYQSIIDAFLEQNDLKRHVTMNDSGELDILLPHDFDDVVMSVDIGALLREWNEQSKQNNLDFSGYMDQVVKMTSVFIDADTDYSVILLLAEEEVIGFWEDDGAEDPDQNMMDGAMLVRLKTYMDKHVVTISNGGQSCDSLAYRILRYLNGNIEEWERKKPEEVAAGLSAIQIAEAMEFVRLGAKTGSETYTLYDAEFNIVYENSTRFIRPAKAGEYTLNLELSWGNEYIYETYQNFFKLIK